MFCTSDIKIEQEIIQQTFSTRSKDLPTINELKPYVESMSNYMFRLEYINNSFPILNVEWVKNVVRLFKNKNVIELSSGPGWLSHWLKYYGLNVELTVDNFSWNKEASPYLKLNYQDWVVDSDSVDTVKENQNADLFILSWPYMDSLAANIWKALKPNQQLLYIGESRGGCTANDSFFDLVKNSMDEKTTNKLNSHFIRFCGIHDRIELYQK